MKKAVILGMSALLLPSLLLTGCARLPKAGTALTDKERKEAQSNCIGQYTALGIVGGSLLGILVSNKEDRMKGAILGGTAGGALAYSIAWGKCLKYFANTNSFPVADARATALAVGYTPQRGNEVRVQSFTVTPAMLAPGGNLNLAGSYYVMAPGDQKDVKVVETRTVHFYNADDKAWKELGSDETTVTAALGTRRSEGQTGMPREVAEGRYRVTFKVSALDRQDQASQEITIKKS
jgi:hypothetical protein